MFKCLCISRMPQNSSGNMQKHGYLWCFQGSDHQEKHTGIYLKKKNIFTQDNSSAKGCFTWGPATYNNNNMLKHKWHDKGKAI